MDRGAWWGCKESDTTELLTLSHFISIDRSVSLSIYPSEPRCHIPETNTLSINYTRIKKLKKNHAANILENRWKAHRGIWCKHLVSLKKATVPFLISTCVNGQLAFSDVKDAADDVSWRPPDSNVTRNISWQISV